MDDDGRLSIDGRMSRFSGSVRDFDEMSTHSGSSSLLSAQGNLVTKMASEKFADPEVLRTCPFDPVHVVQGQINFSVKFLKFAKPIAINGTFSDVANRIQRRQGTITNASTMACIGFTRT